MKSSTVALTLTRSMMRYAAARGASLSELCAAAGISPEQLAAPDERITGEQSRRAWAAAVAATGDDHFGLHLGELAQPATLGLVGYVMLSAATLGDALRKLLLYGNLLTDGLAATLETADAEARMDFIPIADRENFLIEAPRQHIESTFSACLALAAILTGRPLPVRSVHFRHPSPGDASEHQRVFRAPVAFGQPVNRLAFAVQALGWPVIESNPALMRAFEAHAREALQELDRTENWTSRAGQEIARQLRGAPPTLETVAQSLGVSPRTLQRSLESEDSTFRDVLDDVRKNFALRHLRRPETTVAEISFLLGFSDASAFHRSFKRWTGSTPGAFRRSEDAG